MRYLDEAETLSRRTNAATSHEAAHQLVRSGQQDSLCVLIFSAIYARGQFGGTSGEIADELGLPHEKVWRRCSDLEKFGKVRRNGATRKYVGTNRHQKVLVAVREKKQRELFA